MRNVKLILAALAVTVSFLAASTYQANAYTDSDRQKDKTYRDNNAAASRAFK